MQSSRIIFLVGYLTIVAFLLVGSLAPLEFAQVGWQESLQQYREAMAEGVDFTRGRSDLAVNFSIAIPLAFCAMGLMESWGIGRWIAAVVALLTGAAWAAAVEFGQVWLPSRSVSLRDVIAQTAGHAAGVACWLSLRSKTMAWAESMSTQRRLGDRIVWLCYAYLVGVTFYLLLPLDLVSGPGELLRKFKSQKVEMTPFSFPYANTGEAVYAYICDTLRFVPVGILCLAGWRRDAHPSLRRWEAVVLGVGIVIALEAAQLLIASRYTSITDVIFGALGIVIGIGIASRLIRAPAASSETTVAQSPQLARQPSPWILAAIAYVVVLTLVFWNGEEYIQDTQLIRERLTAFYRDAWKNLNRGSDAGNIFNVLQKLAWFAPLGVLSGSVCFVSRVGSGLRFVLCLLAAGFCAAVCFTIELGQVPLPNHTPSIVDAGLGALSAWGGIALSAFVWRAGDSGDSDCSSAKH